MAKGQLRSHGELLCYRLGSCHEPASVRKATAGARSAPGPEAGCFQNRGRFVVWRDWHLVGIKDFCYKHLDFQFALGGPLGGSWVAGLGLEILPKTTAFTQWDLSLILASAPDSEIQFNWWPGQRVAAYCTVNVFMMPFCRLTPTSDNKYLLLGESLWIY